MENLESVWHLGVLALLAGAMLGALAYRLFAPSLMKADKVRSDLEAARQELIDYKASVNSHFHKTSELVNDLTQNYVKVYQHLAEGAQTLGGSRELNRLLEQKPGKVLLAVDDDIPLEQAEPAVESVDSTPISAGSPAHGDSDEAGEPGIGAAAAEAGPEAAETPVSTAAAESSGGERVVGEGSEVEAADSEAGVAKSKTGEPVIDVSRIEQGAAYADESGSGLGKVIPESGKGEEVNPTRH